VARLVGQGQERSRILQACFEGYTSIYASPCWLTQSTQGSASATSQGRERLLSILGRKNSLKSDFGVM